MPLFKKKQKPVEGLDDLPTEDEAGSSMDYQNNNANSSASASASTNAANADINPAAEDEEDDAPNNRGTRQKVRIHKNQARPTVTRLQEAEVRRNQMKMVRQLSQQSLQEEDSIETLLGVDEKGCCLRHPLFFIRSGSTQKPNRYETILDCKLCRQDCITVQQNFQEIRTIDATGQVKRLSKNNKSSSRWRDTKNHGSYKSDEGDVDGPWKEQASLRLDQVLIWDIDTGPLKSNPQYAKYFRMIKDGADVEAVKQICELEEMDARVLNFDPEVPLAQQLEEDTTLSRSTKDEIRYAASSGDGATPEGLENAVNSLHEAYLTRYPKAAVAKESSIRSLRITIANTLAPLIGVGGGSNNKETTSTTTTTTPTSTSAVMGTPLNNNNINNKAATGGTSVMATPVQAIPVQRKKKGRFFGGGGGGGSTKRKPRTKKARVKLRRDSKETLREREMQEIRELYATQREERERRREKRKVGKLTSTVLGNENRTLKLQRAMDELDIVKNQLLDIRLLVDEKNAEGTSLIDQIQILQFQLEERTKHGKTLSTQINNIRQDRGMPPRRAAAADETSTGSYDGLDDLYGKQKLSDRSLGASSTIPPPLPAQGGRVISIGDKIRADNDDENLTPRSRKRKSNRSGRRNRKSSSTLASKRSAASKRREPNFDREFLIEKFQESIRKLITINRFFTQANDLAMVKELDVDQKSFGMRKSVLVDLNIPDFEDDEEWEYYDVEVEEDETEADGDESTVDSVGPMPSFGRNSLQALPMFSPSINHARKSVVIKKSPSNQSLPAPPPLNPDSKVRWNDEKLFTVRVIPRITGDLFYTMDEIKLFRFEKFMDDNANEFEVVDDDEWGEEEIIDDDDDEYSIESYDDESYYSEAEVTVNSTTPRSMRSSDATSDSKKKMWSYDESAFEIQREETPANENEAQPVGSKPVSADSIFRERSLNTDGIGINNSNTDQTGQSASNILDDLIDQVDALIKRKTSESSMPKQDAAVDRSLPEKDAESDQQSSVADTARESLAAVTEDQIQELRRTFHAFDTNGSGYIEHDELKTNLKTLGYNISEDGVNNLLSLVDSKDGRLNFEEFITWNRVLWRDDMKDKFKAIDAKNRGYIDKSQLKGYVIELGHGFNDEELEELCYEMDPEGNDRILLDGFMNVMASSRAGNSYCVINGELYIEKLKADFGAMDADNTGYITRGNLQEMAEKTDYILSEKELDETMKELDLDGNGEISIDEFIAASVRIKDPSVAEKTDESSTSGGFPSGLLSPRGSAGSEMHRLSNNSVSLLAEGTGALETVVETNEHDRASEAAKYRAMIARLANKDKPPEIEANHDAETPKTSSKSPTPSISESNTESSVPSKVAATPTKENPSLSNFFGRTIQNQQAIRQASRSSLSQIDQGRTLEMNGSNEVSMSELSALTGDMFGVDRNSSQLSLSVIGHEAAATRAATTPTSKGTPAEDKPSEVGVTEKTEPEEDFVPGANTRMSSITVDEALRTSQLETLRTSQIENTPGKKTEEKSTGSTPAPAPTPAPAKATTAPVVPNTFKKKSQFLKEPSNSKPKKSLLNRESTAGSKSSMSHSTDDWSSIGNNDDLGMDSAHSLKHRTDAAGVPLVILGDKLEADKQAGVATAGDIVIGPDGKKRRRKRRSKKKPEREPNLDPQFLRDTFKQRIRKLISLNRFFSQATESMFDKDMGTDRKSFGATNNNGVSLLKKMNASDISEMEEAWEDSDDSDANTDEVGSMVSFGKIGGGGRGLNRELSSMSMASTTSYAPPLLTAQPKRSAVMTAERKRPGIGVSFRPENKMHKVKLIPFLTEEQATEFFWSAQELKLFRFEKFMEDNANEFELVEGDEADEDEYEEEEFEEVSWVSGEEEFYDEETVEDFLQPWQRELGMGRR